MNVKGMNQEMNIAFSLTCNRQAVVVDVLCRFLLISTFESPFFCKFKNIISYKHLFTFFISGSVAHNKSLKKVFKKKLDLCYQDVQK